MNSARTKAFIFADRTVRSISAPRTSQPSCSWPRVWTTKPGCITLAGAYSRWFAEAIKDQELAAGASSVEKEAGLSAHDSRARIKELVDKRYTAPAKSE